MDSSIGIKGKDFVIIATDTTVTQIVVLMKNDEEKFARIGDSIVLSATGRQGDAFRAASFTVEKAKHEELYNDLDLTPRIVASIFQRRVYNALRRNPLETKCVVGGVTNGVAQLYSVDNYGALVEAPFVANGYAAYFVYAILDMMYTEDLGVNEGLGILQECINVLKKGLVLDVGRFAVKVVEEGHVRNLVMEAQ